MVQIEPMRRVVNGLTQEHASTNFLPRPQRTQCGILQEIGAETLALPCAIDGEAAQDHSGHRIRHVASNRATHVPTLHATGSQCIEACHVVAITGDKAA